MITLLLVILAGNPSPPPDATAARRGLVNSGNQTFGGKKTFVDGGIVTESLQISSGSSDAGFEVLTATREAMTLFVDATGNDANACTDGGVGACLTFNGIYAKLPKVLRHDVTVNVAAGMYAFSSRWDGANWSSALPSGTTGLSVTFSGPPLAQHTPATGTATGTLTDASITIAPLPVLTDAAQAWTVNELRGRFVTMTSGTANAVTRAIVANTATTLTTTGWGGSTPAIGNTYRIETPAAVITGEHSITGHTGMLGTLRFDRLEFTSASGAASTLTLNTNGSTFSPSAPLCRFMKTSGAQGAIATTRSTTVVGSSSTGPWVAMQTGTGAATVFNDLAPATVIGHGFAFSATTTAFSISNVGSGAGATAWLNLVAETGGAAATAMLLVRLYPSSGGVTTSGLTVRCPSGSTGLGVQLRSAGLTQSSIDISDCGTGINVGSPLTDIEMPPSVLSVNTGGTSTILRCTNTTTCLSVRKGGRAKLVTSYSMSGVTNEVVVDQLTSTFAAVNALSPKRIIGNAYSIFEME